MGDMSFPEAAAPDHCVICGDRLHPFDAVRLALTDKVDRNYWICMSEKCWKELGSRMDLPP